MRTKPTFLWSSQYSYNFIAFLSALALGTCYNGEGICVTADYDIWEGKR